MDAMKDLVAAIRKHAGFKQLAAYSIKALRKSASPPSSGWVANADAAFQERAVPAIQAVLMKNCSSDVGDCELLSDASAQLAAMAAAGHAPSVLEQLLSASPIDFSAKQTAWASKAVSGKPSGAVKLAVEGGARWVDVTADASRGGALWALRSFWESIRKGKRTGSLSDDQVGFAAATGHSVAEMLLWCAMQGPSSFASLGGASLCAQLLPPGERSSDGSVLAEMPDDGIYSGEMVGLLLQALDLAIGKARTDEQVAPFLVESTGTDTLPSMARSYGSGSVGRSVAEAILDGACLGEGSNRHLRYAMRALDRLTLASPWAVEHLRHVDAVERLAPAVEWLQQRRGNDSAWTTAAARSGVRVLSRVLGPDLRALLERSSGKQLDVEEVAVPLREAEFSARLLASLCSSRPVATRALEQASFVTRLVSLLAPDSSHVSAQGMPVAVSLRAKEALCRVVEHVSRVSETVSKQFVQFGAVELLHQLAKLGFHTKSSQGDVPLALCGSALAALAAITTASVTGAEAVASCEHDGVGLPEWVAQVLVEVGGSHARVGEGSLQICSALVARAIGPEAGSFRRHISLGAMLAQGVIGGVTDLALARPGNVDIQTQALSLLSALTAVSDYEVVAQAMDCDVVPLVVLALSGHGILRTGPFGKNPSRDMHAQGAQSMLRHRSSTVGGPQSMSFARLSSDQEQQSDDWGLLEQLASRMVPAALVPALVDGPVAGAGQDCAVCILALELVCRLLQLSVKSVVGYDDKALDFPTGATALAVELKGHGAIKAMLSASRRHPSDPLFSGAFIRAIELLVTARDVWCSVLTIADGTRVLRAKAANPDLFKITDADLEAAGMGEATLPSLTDAPEAYTLEDLDSALRVSAHPGRVSGETVKAVVSELAQELCVLQAVTMSPRLGSVAVAARAVTVLSRFTLTALGLKVQRTSGQAKSKTKRLVKAVASGPKGGSSSDSEVTASTQEEVLERSQRCVGNIARLAAFAQVRRAARGELSASGTSRDRNEAQWLLGYEAETTVSERAAMGASDGGEYGGGDGRLSRMSADVAGFHAAIGLESAVSVGQAMRGVSGVSGQQMSASLEALSVSEVPLARIVMEEALEFISGFQRETVRKLLSEQERFSLSALAASSVIQPAVSKCSHRAGGMTTPLTGNLSGMCWVYGGLALCGPASCDPKSFSGLGTALDTSGVENIVSVLRSFGPSNFPDDAEQSSHLTCAASRVLTATAAWELGAEAIVSRGGSRQIIRELVIGAENARAGRGSPWRGSAGQTMLISLISALDAAAEWSKAASFLKKQGAVDALLDTLAAGATGSVETSRGGSNPREEDSLSSPLGSVASPSSAAAASQSASGSGPPAGASNQWEEHSQAARDLIIDVLTKLLDASSVESAVRVLETCNEHDKSYSLTMANTRLASVALTTLLALIGTATGFAAPEPVWIRGALASAEFARRGRGAAARILTSRAMGGGKVNPVWVDQARLVDQAVTLCSAVLVRYAPAARENGEGALSSAELEAAAKASSPPLTPWDSASGVCAKDLVLMLSSGSDTGCLHLEADWDENALGGGPRLLSSILGAVASAALFVHGAEHAVENVDTIVERCQDALDVIARGDQDEEAGKSGVASTDSMPVSARCALQAARVSRALAEAAAGTAISGPQAVSVKATVGPEQALQLLHVATTLSREALDSSDSLAVPDCLRASAALISLVDANECSQWLSKFGSASARSLIQQFCVETSDPHAEQVLRGAAQLARVASRLTLPGSALSATDPPAEELALTLSTLQAAGVGGLDQLAQLQRSPSALSIAASVFSALQEHSDKETETVLRSSLVKPAFGITHAFELVADCLSPNAVSSLTAALVASGRPADDAEIEAKECAEGVRMFLRGTGARPVIVTAMALPGAPSSLLRAGARALAALDGDGDDARGPGLVAEIIRFANEVARVATSLTSASDDAPAALSTVGTALGKLTKLQQSLASAVRALAAALVGEEASSLSSEVAVAIHVGLRAAVAASSVASACVVHGSKLVVKAAAATDDSGRPAAEEEDDPVASVVESLQAELGQGLSQIAGSLVAGPGILAAADDGPSERPSRRASSRPRPVLSSNGGGVGTSSDFARALGQRASLAAGRAMGSLAATVIQAIGRLSVAQGSSLHAKSRALRPAERSKYLGKSTTTAWPAGLPWFATMKPGETEFQAQHGIDAIVECLQLLRDVPDSPLRGEVSPPHLATACNDVYASSESPKLRRTSMEGMSIIEACTAAIREVCLSADDDGDGGMMEGVVACANRGLVSILVALSERGGGFEDGSSKIVDLARSSLRIISDACVNEASSLVTGLKGMSLDQSAMILSQLLLGAAASGGGPAVFAEPSKDLSSIDPVRAGLSLSDSTRTTSPTAMLVVAVGGHLWSVCSAIVGSATDTSGEISAPIASARWKRRAIAHWETLWGPLSRILEDGFRPILPPGHAPSAPLDRHSPASLRVATALAQALAVHLPVASLVGEDTCGAYDRVVLPHSPQGFSALMSIAETGAICLLPESQEALVAQTAECGITGRDEQQHVVDGLVSLAEDSVALAMWVLAHMDVRATEEHLERAKLCLGIVLRVGGYQREMELLGAAVSSKPAAEASAAADDDSLDETVDDDAAEDGKQSLCATRRSLTAVSAVQFMRRLGDLSQPESLDHTAVEFEQSGANVAVIRAMARSGALQLVAKALSWHGKHSEYAAEACRFLADACSCITSIPDDVLCLDSSDERVAALLADTDSGWARSAACGALVAGLPHDSVEAANIDARCFRAIQSTFQKHSASDLRVAVCADALIGALSAVYERLSGQGLVNAIERIIEASRVFKARPRALEREQLELPLPRRHGATPPDLPAPAPSARWDKDPALDPEFASFELAVANAEDICEFLPVSAVTAISDELLQQLCLLAQAFLPDPRIGSALCAILARCSDAEDNIVCLHDHGAIRLASLLGRVHGPRNMYAADAAVTLIRCFSVHLSLVDAIKHARVAPVLCCLADVYNATDGQPLRGYMQATGASGPEVAPVVEDDDDSEQEAEEPDIPEPVEASSRAATPVLELPDENDWLRSGFRMQAVKSVSSDSGSKVASAALVGAYRPNARVEHPGEEVEPRREPRIVHFAIQALANIACDASSDDDPKDIEGYGLSSGADFSEGASGGVVRVVAAGGIDTIARVIPNHLNRPRLLEDAVCAISNLAYATDSIRLRLGSTCAQQVVGILRAFGKDALLFNMALRAVGNLTRCDENIVAVMAEGAARAMAEGVQEMVAQGRWKVVAVAADVTGNLASFNDGVFLSSLEGEEFLDQAKARLRRGERRRNTVVQASLAKGRGSVLVRRASMAGFDAEFPADATVSESIASFLCIEGLVDTLLSSIRKFSTKVYLVRSCLRAIQYVCEYFALAQSTGKGLEGGVAVVRAVRACDFDEDVAERGAYVLGLLVRPPDPELRACIFEAGAAPLLLSLLDTHKRSPKVALAVVQALIVAGAGSCEGPDVVSAIETFEERSFTARLESLAEGSEAAPALEGVGLHRYKLPSNNELLLASELGETSFPWPEGSQVLKAAAELDSVRAVVEFIRCALPPIAESHDPARLELWTALLSPTIRSRVSSVGDLDIADAESENDEAPIKYPPGETILLSGLRLLASWSRYPLLAGKSAHHLASIMTDMAIFRFVTLSSSSPSSASAVASLSRDTRGSDAKRAPAPHFVMASSVLLRIAETLGMHPVECSNEAVRAAFLALGIASRWTPAARAALQAGALRALRMVSTDKLVEADSFCLLRAAEVLRALVEGAAPSEWMRRVRNCKTGSESSVAGACRPYDTDWANVPPTGEVADRLVDALCSYPTPEEREADGCDASVAIVRAQSAELLGVWLSMTFGMAGDYWAYTLAGCPVKVAKQFRLWEMRERSASEASAAPGTTPPPPPPRDVDEEAMELFEPGDLHWQHFPADSIGLLLQGTPADVWFTPVMHPKAKLKARTMSISINEDMSKVIWSYKSLRFKRDLRWELQLSSVTAVRRGLPLGKQRKNLFARNPAHSRSLCLDGELLPVEEGEEGRPLSVKQVASVGRGALLADKASDFIVDGMATALHVEPSTVEYTKRFFAAFAALVPFAKATKLASPGSRAEETASTSTRQSLLRKPSVRGWWAAEEDEES
jgi:hypothetical protein